MKMRKKALLAAVLVASTASPALARPVHQQFNSWWFVNSVTAGRIHDHLERLQKIASKNNNTRALGTPGYSESVRYIVDRLKKAHYHPVIQPFVANLFKENSTPILDVTSPDHPAYTADVDFTTMQYSDSGDVTAQLFAAGGIVLPPSPDPSSASGCAVGDFAGASGKIALVQRGTCTFEEKAQNAAAAGAVGVIIFNEGNPGRTDLLGGTLTNVQTIPVVGTTFAVGDALHTLVQNGPTTVHLKVDVTTTPIQTWNVLAEKRGRVNNQDVVVGAHLDSVDAGPGINDNGSGSATILTIAEQMTNLHIRPRNTVRFAFWGAEEEGLVGSTHYVDNLSAEALANISLNLNFDMLGSPNFVRFVYDGDGTIGDPGPAGSDVIEDVFTDFFDRRHQASEPTEFDGRSDYFEFINAGIPAGGLFSGAEGIKTAEQQAKYGGTAGAPYDACYHQACDTIRNLNRRSLDQLGKAAAHSVFYFAMTRDNPRPASAAAQKSLAASAAKAANYRGPHLVR